MCGENIARRGECSPVPPLNAPLLMYCVYYYVLYVPYVLFVLCILINTYTYIVLHTVYTYKFNRGHNELDDPSMTQPIMYRAIDSCANIPDQYAAILKEEELADQTHKDYNEYLNECFKNSNNYKPEVSTEGGAKWACHGVHIRMCVWLIRWVYHCVRTYVYVGVGKKLGISLCICGCV